MFLLRWWQWSRRRRGAGLGVEFRPAIGTDDEPRCTQEVISTLTGAATTARVFLVSSTVEAFLDRYIQRYTDGDVRGVTNLCHVPFLAVRRGEAIHMPDSGAVWDHFAAAIGAYRRAARVETWKRFETRARRF